MCIYLYFLIPFINSQYIKTKVKSFHLIPRFQVGKDLGIIM